MKHTEEWHRVGKAFKKTLYYLCAYTCEAFFMKYQEKKYKGVVSKISDYTGDSKLFNNNPTFKNVFRLFQ